MSAKQSDTPEAATSPRSDDLSASGAYYDRIMDVPVWWVCWHSARAQRSGSSGSAGWNYSRWHIVPGPDKKSPGFYRAICGAEIQHENDRKPYSPDDPNAVPAKGELTRRGTCSRCLHAAARRIVDRRTIRISVVQSASDRAD